MGLVYGRMNFSESRRADINHASCSPSKAKTASHASARSRSRIVGDSNDDVNSDANSNGSLPSPRITRQTSRNLASRQQLELRLRRSARLLRGEAIGGGRQMSRNPSRDDSSNRQSRLRRSARVARLIRLQSNKRRDSIHVDVKRRALANPSRMASSRAIPDHQGIRTRRDARLARCRSS